MISEDAIILLVAVISESFDEVLLLPENPWYIKMSKVGPLGVEVFDIFSRSMTDV
jgi:hypothetical protein